MITATGPREKKHNYGLVYFIIFNHNNKSFEPSDSKWPRVITQRHQQMFLRHKSVSDEVIHRHQTKMHSHHGRTYRHSATKCGPVWSAPLQWQLTRAGEAHTLRLQARSKSRKDTQLSKVVSLSAIQQWCELLAKRNNTFANTTV